MWLVENNGQVRNYEITKVDTNENVEQKKNPKIDISKYLKNNKIFVPLVLLIVVIIALVLLPGSSVSNQSSTSTYTTTAEYVASLENKLETVLESIKGAGNVKVMVSVDSGPELIFATNSDENTTTTTTNADSVTNVTVQKEPIIISTSNGDEPLILYEKLPEIKGVIVVSSGANDTYVKLQLISAVQAVLGINSSQIEVFAGI